jgi:hypothetical protein
VIETAQGAARTTVRFASSTATALGRATVSAAETVSQAVTSSIASIKESLEKPEDPEGQIAADPTLQSEGEISDPSVTELVTRGEQEILTGGVCPIVYFNQGDDIWASQSYGTDTIGPYGCGPTALAMLIDSLTETETDPAQMAQYAYRHGYWAKRSGSYLSIIQGVCSDFGLTAQRISAKTAEEMVEELSNGHVLVALMGPGHFTNSGHFILLRGVTLSGSILVADPNSRERSLMEWDAQLLLDELSKSTSNGAPLWVID